LLSDLQRPSLSAAFSLEDLNFLSLGHDNDSLTLALANVVVARTLDIAAVDAHLAGIHSHVCNLGAFAHRHIANTWGTQLRFISLPYGHDKSVSKVEWRTYPGFRLTDWNPL